jgi:hypothetical protein
MKIKLKTPLSLPQKIRSGQHQCLPTEKGRGLCASFFSPDQLDEQAIKYAKSLDPNISLAADIGCSQYFPQSIRFAQIGLAVDAFDLIEPIPEYQAINQELSGKINYIQTNLMQNIDTYLTNKQYHLIYSNRFISHLPYLKAKVLFDVFFKHAAKGCRFFISFGNIESAEAQLYDGKSKSLEKRFDIQNTKLSKKHELTNPVCLYHRKEIYEIFLNNYNIDLIDEIPGTASIKLIFQKI